MKMRAINADCSMYAGLSLCAPPETVHARGQWLSLITDQNGETVLRVNVDGKTTELVIGNKVECQQLPFGSLDVTTGVVDVYTDPGVRHLVAKRNLGDASVFVEFNSVASTGLAMLVALVYVVDQRQICHAEVSRSDALQLWRAIMPDDYAEAELLVTVHNQVHTPSTAHAQREKFTKVLCADVVNEQSVDDGFVLAHRVHFEQHEPSDSPLSTITHDYVLLDDNGQEVKCTTSSPSVKVWADALRLIADWHVFTDDLGIPVELQLPTMMGSIAKFTVTYAGKVNDVDAALAERVFDKETVVLMKLDEGYWAPVLPDAVGVANLKQELRAMKAGLDALTTGQLTTQAQAGVSLSPSLLANTGTMVANWSTSVWQKLAPTHCPHCGRSLT